MIEVAKLNTGEIVQLLKHNEPVLFAKGKWSLVGDLNKRPRKQNLWWVKPSTIVQKWSIG